MTSKAWKLKDLALPGKKVLHVETYGPNATTSQIQAIEAARRQASSFGVKIKTFYRE